MFAKRADGVRVDGSRGSGLAPYRRMMPYLMRTRNESAVYFEQHIDLEKTEAFITRFNQAHPGVRITLFHLVYWAAVKTLAERPNLNRFVAGSRLYQRSGISISYSAKKELQDGSPIVVVKRRCDPEQQFAEMVQELHGGLRESRSDRKTTVDKELSVVLSLPGPLLRLLVSLQRLLDSLGLLPRVFIDNDPLYASLFIANLGSLKMDAAYHHLYEYGSIGLFCVIGRVKEEPCVVDGQLVARRQAVLRWSYDERVEDGLYAQRALQFFQRLLEDPESGGATIHSRNLESGSDPGRAGSR